MRLNQKLKQVAIIDSGAIRQIHFRVQVAQHLGRFHVLRGLSKDGQVGFDGVLETVLFEKFLRAVEVFADVRRHRPAYLRKPPRFGEN
jgi:hypothetical protein